MYKKLSLVLAALFMVGAIAPVAHAQYTFMAETHVAATDPTISSFTISASSGRVTATVAIGSAGTGSIEQCEVSIGENAPMPLTVSTTRSGTTCTGTIYIPAGTALSDVIAVVTNTGGGSADKANPSVPSLRTLPGTTRTITTTPTPTTTTTRTGTTGTSGATVRTASPPPTAPAQGSTPAPSAAPAPTPTAQPLVGKDSLPAIEPLEMQEHAAPVAAAIHAAGAAVVRELPRGQEFDPVVFEYSATEGRTVVPPGVRDAHDPKVAHDINLFGSVVAGGAALALLGLVGTGLVLGGVSLGSISLPITGGLLAIGIVVSGAGLRNLPADPSDPARQFVSGDEIATRKSQQGDLLSFAGTGHTGTQKKKKGASGASASMPQTSDALGIFGAPEMDYRYGMMPRVADDAAVEKMMLDTTLSIQVPNGSDIDGTIWANETTITSDPVRYLRFSYAGDKPDKLWWRISTAPFWDACADPGESSAKYLSGVPGPDTFDTFIVDVSNEFTPAMKNGVYGGPTTYYVQLIGEKKGQTCGAARSNVVTLTVKPKVSYASIANPNAIRPELVTTGKDDGFLMKGEFSNERSGADVIFTGPVADQQMHFRFGTAQKRPSYGRWQVSVVPFTDSSCLAPQGLVAFKDVQPLYDATKTAFAIPFNEVALNKPPTTISAGADVSGAAQPQDLSLTGELGMGIGALFGAIGGSPEVDANSLLYKTYVKGKDPVSYYVRFVALKGNDCDLDFLPSTQVKVSYGSKQSTGPSIATKYEYHDVAVPTSHIQVAMVQYAPTYFQVDPFNPSGHYVYTRDVGAYTEANGAKHPPIHLAGEKFFIPPPPSSTPPPSWWDQFVYGITHIDEFIGMLVHAFNEVVEVYNGLKANFVSGIAGALNGIGIPCDPTCKTVIDAGLGAAQAALGVPPSLPNFDQLMDQGIDYLAKEAVTQLSSAVPGAEYASDVLEEEMSDMLKKAKEEAKKALADPQNVAIDIAQDPAYLYHPARLTVVVANDSTATTTGALVVTARESYAGITTDLKERGVFVPKTLSIPLLAPGEALVIPLTLEENYKDYAWYGHDVPGEYQCSPNPCDALLTDPSYTIQARKARWMQVFHSGTMKLSITASSPLQLPHGFSPDQAQYPGAGAWKKTSATTWYDAKTDTVHTFKPVSSSGGETSDTKVYTTVPAKSVSDAL